MHVCPYLFFDGRCEEAFKFYEKLFGGSIKGMMTHEGSPMEERTPKEWRTKIMHACLDLDGQVLMGADAPPNYYKRPQGLSISLSPKKVADAERIFAGLAENGEIGMALQQTFWAARFGMVTDRFGIPWMINCEKDG